MAQTGTLIPFHFSHKGILFYHGEHLDNQDFEQSFLDSLKDCLDNPEEPDSPVLETLGARGTLYSIIRADENKRKLLAFGKDFYTNKEILERVIKCCKMNQTHRKNGIVHKCSMESMNLTPATAEILHSTRYLDMESDFYEAVYDYYADILAFNAVVERWTRSPKTTEEWVLENEKIQMDVWNTVQTYLKKL